MPGFGAAGKDLDAESFHGIAWRNAARLLTSRQRAALVISVAARIFVGLCDLTLAGSLYLLFLLLQNRSPQQAFWWMPKNVLDSALLAATLVVIRALADIGAARFVFQQIQSIYNHFLLRLTRGYVEMSWKRFSQRNRGELVTHAIHTSHEAADFYHRCVELAAAVVVVLVLTVALVYQSPLAALAFSGVLAVYYALHRTFASRQIKHAALAREQFLRTLQRNIMGVLCAGKEIRAYGAFAQFKPELEKNANRLASSSRRAELIPEFMRITADQGLVLLFLAAIAVTEVARGDTHRLLSLLAFYFVLSRRLIPLVSQLSSIAGQMQSSWENVRIVADELSQCEEFAASQPEAGLPAAGFALELLHVDFGFEERKQVLIDVNLCLRRGELGVICGPSGIGKSSLIDLVAGVARPSRGQVKVDRSAIAYLPQDVALLDDTIRANLLFGLQAKSDDELMRALQLAQLDTFVSQLPKGLDSAVGDNGAQLSGGERQRLGIARAALRGGTLLLLDEATSALDPENERAILLNLLSTGTTILLATHSLAPHQFAQRLFHIEHGRLVEDTLIAVPV